MPVVDVTAALFPADYSGGGTALDVSHGRTFQDRASEAGFFSVKLQNDDADLAACEFGKIVCFSINGTAVFPGVIEAKTRKAVTRGEEAEQVTELKGRGTLALNDSWVVHAEVPGGLVGDTRYFNFAAPMYDDSAWSFALTDVITSGQGTPPNWPDAAVEKIGAVYDADTNAPAGFNWHRKIITIPSDDMYRIHYSADDAVSLFIDGVLVVGAQAIIGKTTQTVDVHLSAGDHLFAAEVENYTGGMVNFIWFLFALYGLNQDGTLGTEVAVSDSTWKAIGYVDPPGFTPGDVIGILRAEAIARGVSVPALSFDADEDTDGTPWPVSPDISFRVGLKGLPALLQLAETYCDLAMDPESLTLHAWVHGARGGPTAAEFEAGVNVMEMGHEVSG